MMSEARCQTSCVQYFLMDTDRIKLFLDFMHIDSITFIKCSLIVFLIHFSVMYNTEQVHFPLGQSQCESDLVGPWLRSG